MFFFGPMSSVVKPSRSVVVPRNVRRIGFRSRLTIIVNERTGGMTRSSILSCIFNCAIKGSIATPRFFRGSKR